jgi:hypothetical protein
VKTKLVMLSIAALALFAAGCDEGSKEGAAAPAPSQSAAPAVIADQDLATEADFDDEAEKEITPATYKTELDSLDKEIAAE